ncbi:hypothetical protein IIA28_05880 [candidate division KSB1 bacterium]|nr:hypothetical protein [candidate division KSB1 bacterium]
MKAIKKLSKLAVAGVLMTAFALNFNACTDQSPLSSTDESPFARDNVQLIDLGDAFASLSKGELKVSAVVTPEDGGQLVLIKGKAFKEQQKDFKESGEIEIVDEDSLDIVGFGKKAGFIISLTVLPHSVKDTTELSLRMDKKSFDMEFGPPGTVFANPALLNIIAVNLKLKKVNLETLGIYYDNPETGQWQKIASENVVVDKEHGFLRIRNTQITHFSRYACAWSN